MRPAASTHASTGLISRLHHALYRAGKKFDEKYAQAGYRIAGQIRNIMNNDGAVDLARRGVRRLREPRSFNPLHPIANILPVSLAEYMSKADSDNRIVWGRLLVGKKRRVSSQYVTAYMPSCLTTHVRGGIDAVYNRCTMCGSRSSSMFESGQEYFVGHKVDYPIVFESCTSDLHVAEDIASKFDWSQFRGIKFEYVDVLDCPRDGFRLPGDPDWAAICEGFEANPRTRWDRPGTRGR